MTEREFHRVVRFMYGNYGIDLSKKRTIVEGRLVNYLKRNGYKDCNQYMDIVESRQGADERQKIVDMLTTNHTYFSREEEHFEFLKNIILPDIRKRESKSKNMRIWSAAASTGQEPYTIAMIIKDFFGNEYQSWDTVILATDISKKVLLSAVNGIYTADEISTLPRHWQRTNFVKLSDGRYQVNNELRREVMFRQFNLMDPFPFKNKMHTVFLRNVMIYFDQDTKVELVHKICDNLEKGGYLVVGLTESVDRMDSRLKYLGSSIYQKI